MLRRGLALGVVLLVFAWLAFETYEVRGNSMQPLLLDVGGRADRLLAVALPSSWIAPKRFDLVIFGRPPGALQSDAVADLDGDRCVKRVIAFAGETPRIDGGDLFLEPRGGARFRLRRSEGTIREMLSEVAAWPPWPPRPPQPEEPTRWQLSQGVVADGPRLRLAASSEAAMVNYEKLVMDAWIDSGGKGIEGRDPVNDVGVSLRATLDPGTTLVVELREQGDLFRIALATDRGLEIERVRASSRGLLHRAEDCAGPIEAGREVELLALNVDDEILVWIDGELAARVDYGANEEVIGTWRNDPSFGVERGAATLDAVRIVRDAYYRLDGLAAAPANLPGQVPEGSLYVLGDNGANSIDSRDFGPIPRSSLAGSPLLRWRPSLGFSKL